MNDEGHDEIGYRLREQYWRQGYGTEIATGLIDYCFKELNFTLLTADVNIENIPSVKILEKFGSFTMKTLNARIEGVRL